MLLHGRVNPNQAGDLERMDMLAERYRDLRMEDLHAVGPRRQGLLPRRRRRPRVDREGAQARRRATSACTRVCRSASDPTSIRPASTSAASPSDFPTSTSSSITRVSSPDKPEGAYDPPRSDGIDALVHEPARQRHQARRERLCGAGLDLALPDARSRIRPRMRSASCSSTSARTTCCGAPTRSGTARRRTRSRRSARFRSRTPLATGMAIRNSRRRCARRCSAATRCASTRSPDDVLKKHLPRDRVAREREEYRERPDPTLRHVRPEDAARIPDSQGVERSGALIASRVVAADSASVFRKRRPRRGPKDDRYRLRDHNAATISGPMGEVDETHHPLRRWHVE